MGEIFSMTRAAKEPPAEIEAEQQVLGAILLGDFMPSGLYRFGGKDAFFDPVHAAIYATCSRLEKKGHLISPVTVKASLGADVVEAMRHLGGVGYLAVLAGAAITPRLASQYAEVLAEAAAKRGLLSIMSEAERMIDEGELGASDIAARVEAKISQIGAHSTAVKPVSMVKALTDAMEEIQSAVDGEEGPIVKSGIWALDRMTGGFGAGELWLLGGRPSMGKTGVMLTMALNAARAGHPVVIASLEMTPRALAMRAISEQTAQDCIATAYSDMRRGHFSPAQGEAIKSAAAKLADLPISFLPREYQNADLLQAGVRQVLRQYVDGQTPLVLVDYAQLMQSNAKGRYEQITEISIALKSLCMSLNVPLVALSQLSRAIESREDKRPIMSDLRESGQLEQDADGVIFCYRDEYYLEREAPENELAEGYDDWAAAMRACRNKLELIVAKQRQGQIGTARVMFNPAINRVWEA